MYFYYINLCISQAKLVTSSVVALENYGRYLAKYYEEIFLNEAVGKLSNQIILHMYNAGFDAHISKNPYFW